MEGNDEKAKEAAKERYEKFMELLE